METSQNNSNKKHWFWGVLKHYSRLYGHVAIASFMINIFALAMPIFVMNVYDRIIPNSAFESLWVLAFGVSIVLILDFILRTVRAYFVETAGRNADVLLMGSFMDTVMDIRLDINPVRSVGGLWSINREVEYVQSFLSSATLIALLDFPFIILFLGIIFMLGGWLVFVPLIVIPILIAFNLAVQIPFERSAQKQTKISMRKNALLGEIAAGFETIKATRLSNAMIKRWDLAVDKSAQSALSLKAVTFIVSNFNNFMSNFLTIAVILTGVYLIDKGTLTMGGLIATIILLGRCMAPLMNLIGVLGNLHKARIGFKSLDKLMALPREQDNEVSENKKIEEEEDNILHGMQIINASPEKKRTSKNVDIILENVNFHYPNSAESALVNINLRIRKGERVAILGASGSGKSTLARILGGLYLPTEGQALYGSINMKHAPMNTLRKNIGFLPQQIVLFSGTIRSNIVDAWPDDVPCTEEAIMELAQLCGIMDFASKHPLGLDMPVGEHSVGFSGGQAQAIALARALAGNPDTIILDEPSSNLDLQSEHNLKVRLHKYFEGKTLILLTHRTSLLDLTHRAVIMQDGRVLQDAPISELVKKNG